MLGKVFEELVTGRHESGSYYTPKPIVYFMCREAIKKFIIHNSKVIIEETDVAVEKFVDEHDASELKNPEGVLETLRQVRCCDLAAGSGTSDLYCFFYARALQLLKTGGMLAFISSNKWFRAKYGEKLRKHIADSCHVHSITDFGELPVFKSAAVLVMIFLAQKESKTSNTPSIFTQVTSLEIPYPDVKEIISETGYILSADSLKSSNWKLTNITSASLIHRMESAGIPLGEYINKKICLGIKTGLNKAFIIDAAKRAELLAKDSKSAEIIKPLAIGNDVRKWRI